MGLAGRKQKQRIPADPRNLSWADDASRFGLSYLSKFGWDASRGLGASGEGIKTHIKVQQKLDMIGIGAQHQRDPNGIAWKQNKDFEALLRRLNDSINQGELSAQDDATELGIGIRGKTFVGAREEKVDEKSRDHDSLTTAKKRKCSDGDHPYSEENTRKKRKKEKKDRHKKSATDLSSDPTVGPHPLSTFVQASSGSHSYPFAKPRLMAHRARIRAAKRIADKSASAISEILGIAPSSSLSTSTPTSPPSFTPDSQPGLLSLDNLTTSAKSVADYFKEKLLARSTTASALPSTPQALSGSTTPGLCAAILGTGSSHTSLSEEGELQQKGMGSQVPTVPPLSKMSGPGSVSENSGEKVRSHNMETEKMRRKAKRKAEKRRRREAEALQPVCESSIQQAEVDYAKRAEKTSKRKKRQEQNQQVHVDGEGVTKKDRKHDTPGGPSPKPKKNPKK